MSRYGSVIVGEPTLTRVVQAAEPTILAALVTAAVAELAIAGADVITAMTLAGAGDGHSFTVTIEAAGIEDATGGLTEFGGVRCYLASTPDALALARAAAGASPPASPLADSQSSGSSKGLRFMGMLVYGVVPSDSPGGTIDPVDTIAVASASRLVDIDATDLPDGTFVFVRSVGDQFLLKRPSAQVVDNITVANAIGGGQWVRVGTPSLIWLYQALWVVNPATGNDENAGTALLPLETWTEWERRMGLGPTRVLQQDTTLRIVGGNIAEGRVSAVNLIIPDDIVLTIEADPVVADSSTLTGATTTDPATNVQQLVNDATNPGWTPGHRIAIATETDPAITFVGLEVSPDEARIGDPIIPAADGMQGSYYEPSGDEDYEVQTLRTLEDGFRIAVSSGGTIVVRNLQIIGGHTAPSPRFRVFYVGCWFTKDAATPINFVAGLGFNNYITCCFGEPGESTSFAYTTPFVYGGVGLGTLNILKTTWAQPALTSGIAHFYVQGTVGWIESFASSDSRAQGLGIFDSATFGLLVVAGTFGDSHGPIYGSGHTLAGGLCNRGAMFLYVNAAAEPTITGALGDWFWGSTFYTYASVPFAGATAGVAIADGAIGSNPGERIQLAQVQLVDGVGVLAAGIFVRASTKIIPIPLGINGGAAMGNPTETARAAGAPGVGSVTITSILLADGTTVATDDRLVDLVLID